MKEIFYDWGGANVWLFHAINDIRFEWLDKVMLLGTALGDHNLFIPYLALLTLFALVAVNRPDQDHRHYQLQATRWMSVVAVFTIAYLLDGLLLGYIKPMLDFSRPPLALLPGTVNVIGIPEYHHSLPSGHSSFAMLVTASLWPVLKRKWRVAGVCFVAWVGISRVNLGAHFPADVLAGFVSSLAVVLLVLVAIRKLLRLPVVDPAPPVI
ncbi:phosphatase PAP2 family protein [Sideroxydans lithotrophicus]|uniref:Phosphoesterase PA-phosphatase related protein n=1 Tax=Sideroxydans lithotrophicus (strain ES-1) TaxID=580332 RepID=D5CTQ9_SIDLE|nr:phosphatase PAP2 family protein [Sideroxydans lithotrophicus]ADE10365.1 phosphoesterase PA-phosphatase related protein [Sideroxydans lithotrophicus ES-1]